MLWSGPPVGHPTPADALAWSRLRLGPARLAWLRALPIEWRHDGEIAVVHAVPGDVWPGVPADAPDDLLDETYRRLEARIAVYAHLHVPFVRHLKGLTVANSGSVGLPLDGDTRSSYLLIDDDQIQIRRVEYDIERSIADLRRVGYPGREYVEARQRTARTRRDGA